MYFPKFRFVTFLVSSGIRMKHAVASKTKWLSNATLKAVSIKLISGDGTQLSQFKKVFDKFLIINLFTRS